MHRVEITDIEKQEYDKTIVDDNTAYDQREKLFKTESPEQ
jgi:hypothetical protein